ncbi:unnamed protein product [Rotaria sordida]|uniref:Uncharacterized protein n=1 Tax=Rotaria sordida TaxID=392033 RepID=A0A815H6M5_9BILA|nr:unnamed protein product [Rotaria sordida]CAF1600351.1 unnamed protein product [Rotaria sordida]
MLSAKATNEDRQRLFQQLQQIQQSQQNHLQLLAIFQQQLQRSSSAAGGGDDETTTVTSTAINVATPRSGCYPYMLGSSPAPRLSNPRLLEDYLDWYLNEYIVAEQQIMRWADIHAVYCAELEQEEENKANIMMYDAAAATASSSSSKPGLQATPTLAPADDQ